RLGLARPIHAGPLMTTPQAGARTGTRINARTAAVVGGGLAGIAAALRLADARARGTLLEAPPQLRGRTHSFRRGVGGEELWIDNGQHVFLRCCTAYRGLLDRLGVGERIELQPRLDITVRSALSARVGHLRRTAGLPPLHLAAGLAGYP